MSDVSGRAAEQARFAAREFVARWYRETGEAHSAVVTDRMLFAYEMGYLRGHGNGMKTTSTIFDDEQQARDACKEEDDAESE